jgi:hypothetical protein
MFKIEKKETKEVDLGVYFRDEYITICLPKEYYGQRFTISGSNDNIRLVRDDNGLKASGSVTSPRIICGYKYFSGIPRYDSDRVDYTAVMTDGVIDLDGFALPPKKAKVRASSNPGKPTTPQQRMDSEIEAMRGAIDTVNKLSTSLGVHLELKDNYLSGVMKI